MLSRLRHSLKWVKTLKFALWNTFMKNIYVLFVFGFERMTAKNKFRIYVMTYYKPYFDVLFVWPSGINDVPNIPTIVSNEDDQRVSKNN